MILRNKDCFHPQNYYEDGRRRPVRSTGGPAPRKQIDTSKPYYRGRLTRDEIVARLEKERRKKRLEAFELVHGSRATPKSKIPNNMQPVVVLERIQLSTAKGQNNEKHKQAQMEPKLILKPFDLAMLDENGCYRITENNPCDDRTD